MNVFDVEWTAIGCRLWAGEVCLGLMATAEVAAYIVAEHRRHLNAVLLEVDL